MTYASILGFLGWNDVEKKLSLTPTNDRTMSLRDNPPPSLVILFRTIGVRCNFY